jgi:FkbM family methyltransferase
MKWQHLAKRWVEKLPHTYISRNPPQGFDVFRDMARLLPNVKVEIVFDVGANIGQSADMFTTAFANPRIYCFEPVESTFQELARNMKNAENVSCYNLAVGATKGVGEMVLEGYSAMYFMRNEAPNSEAPMNAPTEQVDVVTLDDFCRTAGVQHISYLKVDTEGGDLDVIKGAKNMLQSQEIDIVQLEAGMNPKNNRHVPFETLKAFLEPYGYFLFGIYEQVHEMPTGKPYLRRTNPVYISELIAGRLS